MWKMSYRHTKTLTPEVIPSDVVETVTSETWFKGLGQGLKHAARGQHEARDSVLYGPQCFLGIFK